MDYEGTVIVSCGALSAEDIICKIKGVKSLPESVTKNNVKGYPWSFKNKYYSSKINLYALKEKAELDSALCDSIKAIVFYFDSEKQSSFDDVVNWMPFLKDIDAEVQILLCKNCPEENANPGLERKNILQWCVKNQFELVELYPLPESDSEDEDIFPDSYGYSRIVEALQSHTWANLVLEEEEASASGMEKSNNNSLTTGENGLKTVEDQKEEATASGVEKSDSKSFITDENGIQTKVKSLAEFDMDNTPWDWADENPLVDNDPGGERCEALFMKFASMKEEAEGLTGAERRRYAEKVTRAFWKAIGGDSDEFGSLSEDED